MPLERRRRNGYLRSVSYTALLDLRGLLAEWRAGRECRHVMTPMTDHAVCGICGGQWPWGKDRLDAEA